MYKFLLVLFITCVIGAFEAQAQVQDLLVCETGEFEKESAYVSVALQTQFLEDCGDKIRSLKENNNFLFRGSTDSLVWKGGNLYGENTDSTRFEDDTRYERPLGEQRAYNFGTVAKHELGLNPESVFYTGTVGENKRNVKIYRVPHGVLPEEIDMILNLLREVQSTGVKTYRIVEEIRDNTRIIKEDVAGLRESVDRARSASESSEEWARKNYEMLSKSQASWFIGIGARFSSQFGEGVVFQLGRHYPNKDVRVYLENYAETTSHEVSLFERPDPNNKTLHWGTWYASTLFLQLSKRIVGDEKAGVNGFIEMGPGFIHAQYSGPDNSIGFHHTGFMAIARIGATLSPTRRVHFQVFAAEEVWDFPYTRVRPEMTDGSFRVSGHFGTALQFDL